MQSQNLIRTAIEYQSNLLVMLNDIFYSVLSEDQLFLHCIHNFVNKISKLYANDRLALDQKYNDLKEQLKQFVIDFNGFVYDEEAIH